MKYVHILLIAMCIFLHVDSSVLSRLRICRHCRCISLTITCLTLPDSQTLLELKRTPQGSILDVRRVPQTDFQRLEIFTELLERVFTTVIKPPEFNVLYSSTEYAETTTIDISVGDSILLTTHNWVTFPPRDPQIHPTLDETYPQIHPTIEQRRNNMKIENLQQIYDSLYWRLFFPDVIILCISLISVTIACCNVCSTYIHIRSCRGKFRKWTIRNR